MYLCLHKEADVKLKKMKRVIFAVFAGMLLLTSCNGNAVKGSGSIVSQERTASEFYGISNDGTANVNVYPGEDYKVVVTTDDNLQDLVSVEVKNSVLHIDTKQYLRPTKLIVDVHLPKLQSINQNGVGNIKLSDGNASDLDISLSGVGNIDAQNYQVQNLSIQNSGVGETFIWATDSLSGTLSGVGKVYYKGNPKLNLNISGVGGLSKL